MATVSDAPVDLYIAVYHDWSAAQSDWDDLKQLVGDGRILIDGMVLIRRGSDEKIHVDDDFHETGQGAVAGAVGGLVVGLIFPPALLASAAAGTGIGAGVGGLVSHQTNEAITAEVEDMLPPRSSAIVALFEDLWTAPLEQALGKADRTTRHEVDRKSAEAVKDVAARSSAPA